MIKTILTNGILLDGTEHMEPVKGMNLMVEGDKIVELFPDPISENLNSEEYRVLDMHGHYVIPGMINLSVCLPEKGEAKRKGGMKKYGMPSSRNFFSMAKYRLNCSSHAAETMKSGVISVLTDQMDVGVETLVRDWLESANVDGARIFPGSGHLDLTKLNDNVWKELEKTHPQRLWLDGLQNVETSLTETICRKLHDSGICVALKTQNLADVKIAAKAGIDLIETKLEESVWIECMEKYPQLTWLLPPVTELVFRAQTVKDPAAIEELKTAIRIINFAWSHQISVVIGNGAGAPGVDHSTFWKEIFWLMKLTDCDPARVLHTATGANASACGLGDRTGTLEAGKWADALVLSENPFEHPQVLRKPNLMLVRGQIIIPDAQAKTPGLDIQLEGIKKEAHSEGEKIMEELEIVKALIG